MSSQIHFADDNLIGDPNDLDDLIEATGRDVNSDISEAEEDNGRGSEDEQRQAGEDEDEEKKDEDKKVKPVKKKQSRAPQPKLDAERLRGSRGLFALKNLFEDFKFKGKNERKEDLDRVLYRMEYWAHRLFPKLHFEDFLAKMEKLGTKKEIQVYVKRLRMGLVTEADDGIVREYEDAHAEEKVDEPSAFDRLLDEQIAYYDQHPRGSDRTPTTPASLADSQSFAPVTVSTLTDEQKAMIARKKREAQARRMMILQQQREEALDQAMVESVMIASEKDLERTSTAAGPSPSPPVPAPQHRVGITAEQRERMEQNKRRAMERLRARKMAEQGLSNEGTSEVQLSQPLAEPLPLSGSASGGTSKPEVSGNRENGQGNSPEKSTPREDHTSVHSSSQTKQPGTEIENGESSSIANGSLLNSSPRMKMVDDTMTNGGSHPTDTRAVSEELSEPHSSVQVKMQEDSGNSSVKSITKDTNEVSSGEGEILVAFSAKADGIGETGDAASNVDSEEILACLSAKADGIGGTSNKASKVDNGGDHKMDSETCGFEKDIGSGLDIGDRDEPMDLDGETDPQGAEKSDGVSNHNSSRDSCDFELHLEDTEMPKA